MNGLFYRGGLFHQSLLRHLAPIKCINIQKVLKFLGFSLDITYIYISTNNTIPCNTDIKDFGNITQMVARGPKLTKILPILKILSKRFQDF